MASACAVAIPLRCSLCISRSHQRLLQVELNLDSARARHTPLVSWSSPHYRPTSPLLVVPPGVGRSRHALSPQRTSPLLGQRTQTRRNYLRVARAFATPTMVTGSNTKAARGQTARRNGVSASGTRHSATARVRTPERPCVACLCRSAAPPTRRRAPKRERRAPRPAKPDEEPRCKQRGRTSSVPPRWQQSRQRAGWAAPGASIITQCLKAARHRDRRAVSRETCGCAVTRTPSHTHTHTHRAHHALMQQQPMRPMS